MNKKIKMKNVNHICVLTNDIMQSVKKVEQYFDVPTPIIEEYISTAKLRGKELGKYRLKLAMVQIADNLVLEFLQITGGESIELDWLKRHGETLHHIALKVDNIEKEAADWEKKGIKILQENHGKWIYLDAEKILGLNIELVP